MKRSVFLSFGLAVAGSLASAHILAALILPPAPSSISIELLPRPQLTAHARVPATPARWK